VEYQEYRHIREHLASARVASEAMGISTVNALADAAEALMTMRPVTPDSELELMETVHRSVDVVSLLIHDAGRRRQGYPPAALHEAVHTLMEQIERLRPGLVREELTH
jgi:acetylornithine deacetylase/succinyl-diaminopimelate desuccinylase-like protein